MRPRNKILWIGVITVIASALLSCEKHSLKSTQEIEPVYYKSATALTSEIRNGEITSTDLLNIYFSRTQRYKRDVNTVLALDIEAARTRATEADQALARGMDGPFPATC
jgi:hypothetical protein